MAEEKDSPQPEEEVDTGEEEEDIWFIKMNLHGEMQQFNDTQFRARPVEPAYTWEWNASQETTKSSEID